MQLKIGWRVVLELAGLFRLRTRTFEAKTAKRFLQMLCFVFLIFLSKMNGQMQSKLDK